MNILSGCDIAMATTETFGVNGVKHPRKVGDMTEGVTSLVSVNQLRTCEKDLIADECHFHLREV